MPDIFDYNYSRAVNTMSHSVDIQGNLHKTNTIGEQPFGRYREVVLLGWCRLLAIIMLASRPGQLKYGLVSIAWVIVHMRELSYSESG